jgi:hypothetical protein
MEMITYKIENVYNIEEDIWHGDDSIQIDKSDILREIFGMEIITYKLTNQIF